MSNRQFSFFVYGKLSGRLNKLYIKSIILGPLQMHGLAYPCMAFINKNCMQKFTFTLTFRSIDVVGSPVHHDLVHGTNSCTCVTAYKLYNYSSILVLRRLELGYFEWYFSLYNQCNSTVYSKCYLYYYTNSSELQLQLVLVVVLTKSTSTSTSLKL